MTRSAPVAPRLPSLLATALVAVLLGGVVGLPTLSSSARADATTGNLLPGDTASLATPGTWTGSSTLRELSTQTTDAGGALVVSAKLPGPAEVQTGVSAVPALPGSVYTGGFLIRGAGLLTAPVRATLRWYDVRGEALADPVPGPETQEALGRWTHVMAAGVAPPRAAYVTLGASVPMSKNETHYLARPVLRVTTGGPAAVNGPLRTVGNKIVDAAGQAVVLRGVNRSGAYNTTNPDRLSRYDFEQIKAWGANSVRITVGQYLYLPGCPAYDPATADIIDRAVTWATDLGMVAVLDLQWNAPTCETNGLNPMPDPRSKVLWQTLATRYANHPLVAFDLFNEPHSVSDQVWADGGTARTASGVEYQAIGMRELYETVRATGAQNLVFLGGLDHASRLPSTAPLPGTSNVVYAVHAYNCDRPASCTFGTGSSWLLERFVELGETHPVMVTEFGWPTSDQSAATQFNNGVIQFAERQGWGWMPWSWQVNGNCRTGAWWSLIADGTCDVGDTYQPNAAGMPVLQGLQKNR